MRNFKRGVGVAVVLAIFWATFELYAWIGHNGMLFCSLIGLLFVAGVRAACKYSADFRNSYFPAMYKSMKLDEVEVHKAIVGIWALSATGFIALAILGWWLILATHVIMVWLIMDDVKTAFEVQGRQL